MFMECCDNSQYKLDTGSVLSQYERSFKQPEEITPADFILSIDSPKYRHDRNRFILMCLSNENLHAWCKTKKLTLTEER
jgi:hypothetical protein